jgi:hypothetical protein
VIEIRYLAIKWVDNKPVSIFMSPDKVHIEVDEHGRYCAETVIFHEATPWIAISNPHNETPMLIRANGDRVPFLSIVYSGKTWWILLDSTNDKRNPASTMHRQAGEYTIEIGAERLIIDNAISDTERAQDYLDDFKAAISWLAINARSPATGTLGASATTETDSLIEALQVFIAAARKCVSHPRIELHRTMATEQASKLKNSASVIREKIRRPFARTLAIPRHIDAVDTPENRYVAHMLSSAERIAKALSEAERASGRRLKQEAKRSQERLHQTDDINEINIDKDIFENQLDQIREEFGAWYLDDATEPEGKIFDLTFDARLGNGATPARFPGAFDTILTFLPDFAAQWIEARPANKRTVAITGNLRVPSRHPDRDNMLAYDFGEVQALEAPEVMHWIKKKREYDRNGWKMNSRKVFIQDLNADRSGTQARITRIMSRAAKASVLADAAFIARTAASGLGKKLRRLGVKSSPVLPSGMGFVSHPAYAACLAAYRSLLRDMDERHIDTNIIDVADRVGLLHASMLYERWCLAQIMLVLAEEYHFVPKPGWSEALSLAIETRAPAVILLERHDIGMHAQLEYEGLLGNGKRPDFRLRFSYDGEVFGPGIIMDAKFRTNWTPKALFEKLEELVLVKSYDIEGDRVFILHPSQFAIKRPVVSHSWGRHCDYGHERLEHRQGTIHASTLPQHGVSHLQRLIALGLQAAFKDPRQHGGQAFNRMFCIACGKGYHDALIEHQRSKKGNDTWYVECRSCQHGVKMTHCGEEGCGTILYKNLSGMMYHKTIIGEPSNIVCPSCDSYLGP